MLQAISARAVPVTEVNRRRQRMSKEHLLIIPPLHEIPDDGEKYIFAAITRGSGIEKTGNQRPNFSLAYIRPLFISRTQTQKTLPISEPTGNIHGVTRT
jgi:hypothetical protein